MFIHLHLFDSTNPGRARFRETRATPSEGSGTSSADHFHWPGLSSSFRQTRAEPAFATRAPLHQRARALLPLITFTSLASPRLFDKPGQSPLSRHARRVTHAGECLPRPGRRLNRSRLGNSTCPGRARLRETRAASSARSGTSSWTWRHGPGLVVSFRPARAEPGFARRAPLHQRARAHHRSCRVLVGEFRTGPDKRGQWPETAPSSVVRDAGPGNHRRSTAGPFQTGCPSSRRVAFSSFPKSRAVRKRKAGGGLKAL